MSAFSFHGSKTLTTGEGGMLGLDDDQLLTRIMRPRDHGRALGDAMLFNEEVGWK
jgi:perosamine synthetase